jgi:hypothetical protein
MVVPVRVLDVMAGTVAGALAIVAAIGVAGATGSRAGPAPAAGPRHVEVIGDSLVRQAEPQLRAKLAGEGLTSAVVSSPGEDLSGSFVRARLRAITPDEGMVVLIATAANDSLRLLDRPGAGSSAPAAARAAEADYERRLREILERYAPGCVVVVNARDRVSDLYHPDQTRQLNAVIARLEARHTNLVVVDWARLSRELPPAWFAADQLHFGPDPRVATPDSSSALVYAGALLGGVNKCMSRHEKL